MKIIVWGLFSLLALIWTGSTALIVEAVQWTSERLLFKSSNDLEMVTSNIVIPFWLNPLLDPSGWATILQTVQSVIVGTATVLPFLGSMMGWISPVIWLIWGIGMLALLAFAIAGNVLVNRLRRQRQ